MASGRPPILELVSERESPAWGKLVRVERVVTPGTADAWLKVFREDEPGVTFYVREKPMAKRKNNPELSGSPRMAFRDLLIGDRFDFNSGSVRDSFTRRLMKVSARGYIDSHGIKYSVGSINVPVYNVEARRGSMTPKQFVAEFTRHGAEILADQANAVAASRAWSAAYDAKRGKNPTRESVLRMGPMSESEMASYIRQTQPNGVRISADRKSIAFDDGSRWVWDARFSQWSPTMAASRSKNPAKRPARGTPKYVGRPSERTKAKPTKRLRKRRKANKREGYFPNPVTGFVIHAQKGAGPLMHYRGDRFTNNGAPKVFATQADAVRVARDMLAKHPILRGYRVTVEPYSPK